MTWKSIEKDGMPANEGAYLVIHKHINYPYSVTICYYNGHGFATRESIPIVRWCEMPAAPEESEEML